MKSWESPDSRLPKDHWIHAVTAKEKMRVAAAKKKPVAGKPASVRACDDGDHEYRF